MIYKLGYDEDMKIVWGRALMAGGVVSLAAVAGSMATSANVSTWYPLLNKSPLNPPAWVFGSVWTILFALMAVAFYQVLGAVNSKKKRQAVRIFCWQLVVTVMWSVVFFGLKGVLSALLVLFGLWLSIVATMFAFQQVNKTAAWLLLPYLLWVSFAGYLNYAIFVLN